jgi:hypothetical protein
LVHGGGAWKYRSIIDLAVGDRLEAEVLAEEERGELLEIAGAVEMQDAERARAMFELATLRGVDLTVIVRELRME